MSDASSRYKNTSLLADGEVIYHGTRTPVDASPRGDDSYVTIKYADTLHSIAQRHLRDFRLWWVVADFNDIIDPFEALPQGGTLRLPSLKRLWMETLR